MRVRGSISAKKLANFSHDADPVRTGDSQPEYSFHNVIHHSITIATSLHPETFHGQLFDALMTVQN